MSFLNLRFKVAFHLSELASLVFTFPVRHHKPTESFKRCLSQEEKAVHDPLHGTQKHKQVVSPPENFFEENIERIIQKDNWDFWCDKVSPARAMSAQLREEIQTDVEQMCTKKEPERFSGRPTVSFIKLLDNWILSPSLIAFLFSLKKLEPLPAVFLLFWNLYSFLFQRSPNSATSWAVSLLKQPLLSQASLLFSTFNNFLSHYSAKENVCLHQLGKGTKTGW